MEIKIKKDASAIYAKNASDFQYSSEWWRTLQKVAGKTLVVETEFLFRNQFNTAPIEGVSENGLRIMEEWVEEVIDDKREYKMRCNYCGKTSNVGLSCSGCFAGRNYLTPLSKKAEISFDYLVRANAEAKAGGKCEVNRSLPYVAITCSDGSEYYMQGEEAENAIKEYEDAESWLMCSIEDYFLAISQNW